MAHISYSVRGAAPRTIPVPTVSEARNKSVARRDRLDQFVIELGQLQGAAAYCRACFTLSGAVTSLVLHDNTGPLQRFI